MIRNLITLTLNDLAIALSNKTLILVLFIPLFIFLSLTLVDSTEAKHQKLRIGLIEGTSYGPGVVAGIEANAEVFVITFLSDIEQGETLLKEKKLDGILIKSVNMPASLELIVLTKASFQTLAIIDNMIAIQNAFEGKADNWITDIHSLQLDDVQKQTLPTWILMLVLLVGFIILPVQVAEEKEKKLLLGLLQTPIREYEWLLAKLLLGVILICMAIGLLQLLGGFGLPLNSIAGYVTLLMAGGFCFSAFGILLGFLCRKQSSARTLGVLFYLPNLLPAALSDFSQTLTAVAPLFPSFHFYGPIKSMLLEGAHLSTFTQEIIYLVCVGLVMSLLSCLIMKKRWLM